MDMGDAVILDYTKKEAKSFLCQAMCDEVIRLRTARYKERASIREFLIEAYAAIVEDDRGVQCLDIRSECMPQS